MPYAQGRALGGVHLGLKLAGRVCSLIFMTRAQLQSILLVPFGSVLLNAEPHFKLQ